MNTAIRSSIFFIVFFAFWVGVTALFANADGESLTQSDYLSGVLAGLIAAAINYYLEDRKVRKSRQ